MSALKQPPTPRQNSRQDSNKNGTHTHDIENGKRILSDELCEPEARDDAALEAKYLRRLLA